jgi:hypothetical protein
MTGSEPTENDHPHGELSKPEQHADRLQEPSAARAASRIGSWYPSLEPRLGIYLTDPNVVITLADARGQTEFYIQESDSTDANAFEELNKLSLDQGIRFSTERYTSKSTNKPALSVNVESLAGYQRVSEATKLPGITKLDVSGGWDAVNQWLHESLNGIRAATKQGLYPQVVLEDNNDLHALTRIAKGYPDEAIMAMLQDYNPEGIAAGKTSHTKVPYADYYPCAQPGYIYAVAEKTVIDQHVKQWGKILEEYFTSDGHNKLAGDTEFKQLRAQT